MAKTNLDSRTDQKVKDKFGQVNNRWMRNEIGEWRFRTTGENDKKSFQRSGGVNHLLIFMYVFWLPVGRREAILTTSASPLSR